MRIIMTSKNKAMGFTLIELMITVAIIGIISSIAVPSYMTYVKKSKRTEAQTELLRIAQLQESHYVQNLSYAKALNSGLGFAGASHVTESGLYSITTTGGPTTCDGTNAKPCTSYQIAAEPVSGKGQDKDEKCVKGFLYTNTGFKGAKGKDDTDYKSAAAIKECWG